jgi:hypothetical protein
MSITLQPQMNRLYFVGETFSVKDKLKALGARWDADRRQWWIAEGARKAAETLLATLADMPTEKKEEAPALREAEPVIGKAVYKNNEYWVLWKGVTARGNESVRLAFLDGKSHFWVDLSKPDISVELDLCFLDANGKPTTTFGKLMKDDQDSKRAKRRTAEAPPLGFLESDDIPF